ncbi:hypothetical protein QOZ80_4AG0327810 [Eleusine coracana subsp. coracana]|nr:hypothetical protein QOZ80_4AG0327810 [Eleusine coracana subsp. coracana]
MVAPPLPSPPNPNPTTTQPMARAKVPRRPRHQPPGGKKPAPPPSTRIFSPEDDITILEAIADYVAERDKVPRGSEIQVAIKGRSLTQAKYTDAQLYEKVRRLKAYLTPPADPAAAAEARKHELAIKIWGKEKEAPAPAKPKLAKKRRVEPRGFEEMRDLFPNLSATVEKIATTSDCGETYKAIFEFMDDEEAAVLEAKVKKLRIKHAKMMITRDALSKQVIDVLMKSVG